MIKIVKMIVAIILLTVIVACQNKEEQAVDTFNASDFNQLFDINQEEFSEKYEGKEVIIKGMIESILVAKEFAVIELFDFELGVVVLREGIDVMNDLEKYDYITVIGKVYISEDNPLSFSVINSKLIQTNTD